MKKIFVFSLLLILGSGSVFSQVLNAFMGTTPNVNGTISEGEWSDANLITFNNGQGIITVYVKHDGNAIYFAAEMMDSVYYWGDDIVISLDPDHNAGASPQTDDIELYIRRDNTTSVLFQGSGSGWINMSNINGLTHKTSSTSGKWQAECSIIYSRLGIISGTPKSVGVEFRNYDDASGWFNYPLGGAELIPSSWADLSITFTNSVTERKIKESEVKVCPNPAKFNISLESPSPASIEFFDLQGLLIKTLATNDDKTNIDVSSLPAGIYFIKVISNKEFVIKKLIIQ